jgi:hypothetical protein
MSGESSETLHLTQLERESGGSYACAAENQEGETRSSTLTLRIQCKSQRLFYCVISNRKTSKHEKEEEEEEREKHDEEQFAFFISTLVVWCLFPL